MNEQQLYQLVESIVREELTRRGAGIASENSEPQKPTLMVVFT